MSKIEVNTVAPQCGTTLTLGESGDTVVLGTGANQSGFGRSGSVNWQTTPKTATFTAADGEGYFVNSGSALTMNLPAGSAGAIVAVSDYARNFSAYNLTVSPNGSEKIGGVAADAILNIDGQAATFVYVDGTKGWINVQNAEDTEAGASYITATGGTITTVDTNFKVHTFTGPGTFCVSCAGSSAGSNTISYLVVGGGSAGGYDRGGGGGAGGFRESKSPSCVYSESPLAATGGLPVAATGYPVTVGGGGAVNNSSSGAIVNGDNSVFAGSSTITAAGGGGAGNPGSPHQNGNAGGSGGGARDGAYSGGAGNTPPVSPPQGQPGGSATGNQSGPGGGGGGATQSGFDGQGNPSTPTMGDGGDGATTSINGSPTTFAGGGGSGGGGGVNAGGEGGTGGGGNGASQPAPANAQAGTVNTGGGGGAGNGGGCGATAQGGAAGGSGIVIIRYRFQG
jgi:hypothetical protein